MIFLIEKISIFNIFFWYYDTCMQRFGIQNFFYGFPNGADVGPGKDDGDSLKDV